MALVMAAQDLDGKLESRLPLTCADPADIFID